MARSIKKGPYIDKNLFKKIGEMNSTGEKKMIKTYYKLGEFSPTRLFRGHAGSDKKARKK